MSLETSHVFNEDDDDDRLVDFNDPDMDPLTEEELDVIQQEAELDAEESERLLKQYENSQ